MGEVGGGRGRLGEVGLNSTNDYLAVLVMRLDIRGIKASNTEMLSLTCRSGGGSAGWVGAVAGVELVGRLWAGGGQVAGEDTRGQWSRWWNHEGDGVVVVSPLTSSFHTPFHYP